MPLLSELLYPLFWHISSVLKVTYYAQNNASKMWKNLLVTPSVLGACVATKQLKLVDVST